MSEPVDPFQRSWWSNPERYRSASHPISRIYAEGKLDFLFRHVSLPEGARVLDVGTGNGTLQLPLSGRRYDCVGVDTSPDLLAQHPFPDRVVMASVMELPFPDRSFDLVLCSCLLHHVDDRGRAVAEMARVSRGLVCLIEPNRWNLLQTLHSLAIPAERGGLDFDSRYLEALLRRASLSVVASDTWGMTFPNKAPPLFGPMLRLLERPLPMGNVCMSIGDKAPARLGGATSPEVARRDAPPLLDLLVCPVCKKPLRRDEAAATLVCGDCVDPAGRARSYAIENGVPNLIPTR